MCCDYDCFSVVDRQELYNQDISLDETYNGKIVAECDYDVEEIGLHKIDVGVGYYCLYETTLLEDKELINQSCLDCQQLVNYLGTKKDYGEKVGYAIHIKNLHIFDKPRELLNISKAPQNMMKYLDENDNLYILISIRPEWLCKILNKEKTIEVRKKVLKEMLKNE